MTRHVKTLIWLLGIVLLARLALSALIPFMDTTEPRYAEIARVMAETGDWITPWFDVGVPFWGKPPLSFWAQALSFKLFGINELAGRFPSWLANLGVVGLVYATGMAIQSNRERNEAHRNALWAALIYATTALGFLSAGTVMTDSFLTLGTTLTLASLIMRLSGHSSAWGWGFFAGLAIGLLAKGPLAMVLTGIPVFVWVVSSRQWRTLWHCLPWITGTAAMLAMVLPWYVLAELKTPGFLDYFIVGEHIKRFIVSNWHGDLYGDAHEFTRGTIWLYLLLASFPWGFVLIGTAIQKRFRKPAGRPEGRLPSALRVLLIASALTPAVFFSFSGNILWTYVLPGLPFLALLVARYCPLPEKGALRNAALASTLMIPALGTVATVWVQTHPGTLKTEKYLIGRHESQFGTGLFPVRFLEHAPFSARFYSEGRVEVVSWDDIQPMVAEGAPGAGMYIAVNKKTHSATEVLNKLAVSVDEDQRYTLYHIPGTTAQADSIPLDKNSPDA
ncbi:phospholipid carrier-dependent glycosyltransferase [Marinobacter salinus]|uniref:Phospholipid carrier-dependent glycosyltransferase n=1 Tax=Marinobacter salinus TaxID=1874317 RepID=A0A1D9GNJ8_9GAMM|nr:glycosyltransferase family 39 protein [Marinobacter salinus]AOY89213.1 phospholipid carrier-dependent glycosyltransferase [Marinobacter salinus]